MCARLIRIANTIKYYFRFHLFRTVKLDKYIYIFNYKYGNRLYHVKIVILLDQI